MHRRLFVNLISNYTNAVIASCTTLLLTPVLFQSLTAANYGVLAVALAIAAVCEAVDLGLHSAVIRFTSDSLSTGSSRTSIHQVLSTSFFLLMLVGTALAAVVWLVVRSLGFWQQDLVLLMLLCAVPLQMGASLLRAALEGQQQFFTANLADIIFQLVRALLVLALLFGGGGLTAVAAAYVSAAAVRLGAMAFALHQQSNDIFPSVFAVYLPSLKVMREFAPMAFFHDTIGRVAAELDTILVAAVAPLPAVGLFAVARKLPLMLLRMAQVGVWVSYPTLCAVDARKQPEVFHRFFTAGLLLVLLAVGGTALYLGLWADVILQLWVPGSGNEGITLIRWYAAAVVFIALREIPFTVMYARGDIGPSAVVQVSLAIILLAVGLAAAQKGLLTFAATYAAIQCTATMVLLAVTSRKLKIPILEFLSASRNSAYIAIALLLFLGVSRVFLPASTTGAAIAGAAALAVLAFAIRGFASREFGFLTTLRATGSGIGLDPQ